MNMETAPEQALAWYKSGLGAVIATVIETWGSAPRRVGAQLVVSGTGEMMGSVSGGCVEGAVVVEAIDALADGSSRVLEYGISDDEAFSVGLACGGKIRILVEPVGIEMPVEMLEALVAARTLRQKVAYVVNLHDWTRHLTDGGFAGRFSHDLSGVEPDGITFVTIHNPPLRLAIVGAVHIAQALVPMSRLVGYDPVIIDPREAFGSEVRFPGERLLNEWPDDALNEIAIDARTAVVLLTHDPKLDDPALHVALNSGSFYIGALGSKRTHAQRVERLTKSGFSIESIGRIKGPIGLDIAAASPAEIAVSIVGQMIQTLRCSE
ncbi:MAG: XdhC family protein [Tateyamaria sp.]|nr:XdhC family protein [Tateyamaria sp.]